jgi:hypothetical protein
MELTPEDANGHFVAQDTLSLFCSVNAEKRCSLSHPDESGPQSPVLFISISL